MKPPRAVLKEGLRRAGQVLSENFGRVSFRYKGHADLLTRADTESQRAILDLLRRELPDHDYLAEEDQRRLSGSPYLWVIDPLDGTTNYAHGYPMACASIGLLERGKPLLGGIYDPFRDELFIAERGKGAFLNGKRLSVTRTGKLGESLLVTGFPYDRHRRSRFYTEHYRAFMVKCHDIRRSGSAALDMAWVAAGRADGYWEFSLNPWDVAAGWLLVAEAGGKVSDFAGKPWSYPGNIGRQTLASNGRIHGAMVSILRGIERRKAS